MPTVIILRSTIKRTTRCRIEDVQTSLRKFMRQDASQKHVHILQNLASFGTFGESHCFEFPIFEIRHLCLGFFRDRKAVDFRAEIFLAGALEDARRDGDILVRRADRFE